MSRAVTKVGVPRATAVGWVRARIKTIEAALERQRKQLPEVEKRYRKAAAAAMRKEAVRIERGGKLPDHKPYQNRLEVHVPAPFPETPGDHRLRRLATMERLFLASARDVIQLSVDDLTEIRS